MAPLSRVLLLAAIVVVVAMAALSPSPVHGRHHNQPPCGHLPGCTPDLCRKMCQYYYGYADPAVTCGNTPPGTTLDTCCCMNN
ncbi:hypothetical protein GQ55_6G039700 [Panicum hallii var. hallii]|uniref:Bifunctional inhibitor/plant lipid transfer protein/seed storage helical domain-containing protein n=1 Tax=Panicum hallii var. hallii TaxID=1504633 RepID=A0A2T7D3Q8_9POAL|nr:hypothetical protein GQ55_6G039700 [Panicum hallii var. hallii]